MARLQDFPSVTPSDSDKILIVQSQGQGLATFGSTLGAKMNKTNPSGNGSLSLNRKSGTTVGYMSTTEGTDGTATGNYSHAGGYQGVATSFASYAEGQSCEASGYTAHAQGLGTKANHRSQFAFGEYNVADASTADATAKGNYIEIVGKGSSDANRSNARTLDWNGNEVLAGGLSINGNQPVSVAPIRYNANTDRNVESNRQNAMKYLRTNVFTKGGTTSLVRYSGGYYNTYIYGGNSGTEMFTETFIEFAQNLSSGEKIIYWIYTPSNDTFTKAFSIS